MSRAKPTKKDLTGQRFGKLTVVCRSDRRGSRGARTVPLWECLCDCGKLTYKATDTLTNPKVSMCGECAVLYAAEGMRRRAGFVDGTQISRLKSSKLSSLNTSGARGVYFERATNKWRARLRFQGKLMDFGSYSTFEAALQARRAAEREYFGAYLDQTEDNKEK
ncbi:MAG: hypothetical protein E7620_04670 [Ruminococcaceae bacterium]|nr:hypothetical protein [Oscillospiraceae bacterium]